MSDEEMGVVIRRDFGGLASVKERTELRCRHLATVVDEIERTVACGTCNAPLDAFQVLLEYACKERHYRHWIGEVSKAQRELAELRAEERKVKARTRAASRKDATQAVKDEQARTERMRLDTINAARDVAAAARRIERLMQRGPQKEGA